MDGRLVDGVAVRDWGDPAGHPPLARTGFGGRVLLRDCRASAGSSGRRATSRAFGLALALTLAAALLGSWCGAAHASGGEYLYWANDTYNTIERSNFDGTQIHPTFITGAELPFGVAVSNKYIYWTDASGIGRANLDGSHINDKFIVAPSSYDGGLAVSTKYIYWTEENANAIGRADINGTHPDTSYLTAADGVADPVGVAVDGKYIYWTDDGPGTIGRATLDGKTVWQHFIVGAIGPISVAVNASYIFWANYGDSIGRANLDGTDVNQNLIPGGPPEGVTVTASYVYWTSWGGQTIGRANLDGSDANTSFVSPAQNPGQIAVSPNAIGETSCPVCTPVKTSVPPPRIPLPTTKPLNTTPPTISGTAQDGNTLSASNGSWSGSTPITFTYQWRICSSLGGGCTNILGQTAQPYLVTTDDVGNTLDVVVTASNTVGSGVAVSAVTAKISAAPGTTTTPATTATAVTVTTEGVAPFTFTLSTATQPNIVSDTPAKGELNVPPGTVTFTVSNPVSNILSHTFEICTTPLAKPVTTLPGVQALPNNCTGKITPLLAPGGATATLTVDLTTPGAYEYLSTANNPGGDASSGMKGVLNVT